MNRKERDKDKEKTENVGMEGRDRKKVVEFFWMVYQVRE